MIKDICVYLDGEEYDAGRLDVAGQVAGMFDAFVAGAYLNVIPDFQATGGFAFGAIEIDSIYEELRRKGDSDMEKLRPLLDRLALRSELSRLEVAEPVARQVLVNEARYYDLFIATRPYGTDTDVSGLTEAVLFGSGRATLLVPPEGEPRFNPETVVIAWRNTREAARAVSEAMPFLKRAQNVVVCMIGNGDKSSAEKAAEGTDLARHLDRHGVPVQLNPVSRGRGEAETLLEEAALANAGLLVMGGYGHSRLRQWVLGGMTRGVLSEASMPVLIAH